MYRQYENPHTLEHLLKEAEQQYLEELDASNEGDNVERLVDLANEINDLKERINFAWQDIEYDEMYY